MNVQTQFRQRERFLRGIQLLIEICVKVAFYRLAPPLFELQVDAEMEQGY